MQPVNAVHPMCLAPVIAYEWVKEYHIPAYCYDVVMTDEMDDVAKVTSLPEIKRGAAAHMLNTRAVAIEVAEQAGTTYDKVNYQTQSKAIPTLALCQCFFGFSYLRFIMRGLLQILLDFRHIEIDQCYEMTHF